MKEVVRILNGVRIGATVAAGFCIVFKTPYAAEIFGVWLLTTVITGILELPKLLTLPGKARAYFANFRNERKAEIPWIVSIVVVNVSYHAMVLLLLSGNPDKDARRALAEQAAAIWIAMNLLMLTLTWWATRKAKATDVSGPGPLHS